MTSQKKETAYPVSEHIGKRVRIRRGQLRMSQADLAEIIGVTFQQVQKYERGGNRVSADRLVLLATALHVPVSWFFEGLDNAATSNAPEGNGSADDPMTRTQTLELVSAFWKLPEPVRNQFSTLVKVLSRTHRKDRTR